jgi:hypothetical protein
MPSPDRRTVLASLGTALAGGLAGCGSVGGDSPSAGSLRFQNDHDLPHSIRIEVTGVGTEPGDDPGSVTGTVTAPPAQRGLTATTTIGPGESETYESVFTERAWYGVRFTLDGDDPENDAGRTAFNPAPAGEEAWRFLGGRVFESGDFSWGISSTENPGTFD